MTATDTAPEGVKTLEMPKKKKRRWLRLFLLLVVPLIAGVVGTEIYLRGGRYVSTDNAYVGAQKVLVTPEVSGTVASIAVAEGQALKTGDVLFSLNRSPFELALNQAQAQVLRVQNDFAVLKDSYAGFGTQIALAKGTVDLRQGELDRKEGLLASKVVSANDVESYRINLQTAKAALEALEQTRRTVFNQLGGNPDTSIDTFAPYIAAKAAVATAQWNLDQTVIKAPMDGIATQVANVQLGRFLPAGSTVFAIVSSSDVWVDANPKETDITYLSPGLPATVTIDAYPDKPLKGKVASISPGTGSVFSIIPAQNAAGNWVKVVQRVPVRIQFDPGQDLSILRSGMSTSVAIDTGRVRSLGSLLGTEAIAQVKPE